jgi:ribonuclease P protein component
MRRSEEFARAVRSGRRAGSRTIVVHVLDASSSTGDVAGAPVGSHRPAGPTDPARIGFVVGRGVGGSVVRSQVSRRLRHVVRDRLGVVPDGSLVVVRALGPAGSATSAALAADVDRAFARLSLTGASS